MQAEQAAWLSADLCDHKGKYLTWRQAFASKQIMPEVIKE